MVLYRRLLLVHSRKAGGFRTETCLMLSAAVDDHEAGMMMSVPQPLESVSD
jgi:hypothetical protein